MDKLGCLRLSGVAAVRMVVQIAVRVPALRSLGMDPGVSVGLVVLSIPLSVGDCGNGSLAPCPSNAAFVCYPSAFAHGRASGVS